MMETQTIEQKMPELNDLDHERLGILAMKAGPWFDVDDEFEKMWRTKDKTSVTDTIMNLLNNGYIRLAKGPVVHHDYKMENGDLIVYSNVVKVNYYYEFTDYRLKNFIARMQKMKAWKRPSTEEEKEEK